VSNTDYNLLRIATLEKEYAILKEKHDKLQSKHDKISCELTAMKLNKVISKEQSNEETKIQ
tara:strand:+ start:2560 stop:2742 length:183 start_codon:yes stop_codon:yes gene_type:complete